MPQDGVNAVMEELGSVNPGLARFAEGKLSYSVLAKAAAYRGQAGGLGGANLLSTASIPEEGSARSAYGVIHEPGSREAFSA